MNKTFILKISLIIIGILFISLIVYLVILLNSDIIYGNVKINEVDISGLSRDEAIDLLKKELKNDIVDKEIEVYYENYTKKIKLSNIIEDYKYEKTVNEAYNIGRESNFLKRIIKIIQVRKKYYNYKLEFDYNFGKIEEVSNTIKKELDKEKKEASISFNDNKFNITKESIGIKVDNKKLTGNIINSLNNDVYKINIPVEKVMPKLTKKELSKINGEIGKFTTYFSSSNTNRVQNIKVATEALNNKLLLKDEILSFNETTGKRDKSKGYKKADIIINGELVPGYGGGVCQVSTTLYNAVLLSNLEVIERYHHSIPSTYIEKGKDATVAYGYLDFRFKNPFDYPVYIYGESNENRVTFKIYGDKNRKTNKIKIQSDIIEIVDYNTDKEIDNSLKSGEKIIVEKGRKGYKVKTYKLIYKENKLMDKMLISYDYYRPKEEVIKIGPEVKKDNETIDE